MNADKRRFKNRRKKNKELQDSITENTEERRKECAKRSWCEQAGQSSLAKG
jgi:hypothetical protein